MLAAVTGTLRIRIVRKPGEACIDGVRLDQFQVGNEYEVGNTLGALFLAEGWAEPVTSDAPALMIPFTEIETDDGLPRPQNLIREVFPPYYDGPPSLATERRRRPRRRSS